MARPRTFDEATVLNAARELFWRKGYTDTSISDLEEATGLKRTSLYAAFQDKETLYHRTLTGYQRGSQSKVDEILSAHPSAVSGLRALLLEALRQLTGDEDRKGCFIANAASERSCSCPRVHDFVSQNRAEFVSKLMAQIELAQEQGDLRAAKPRDLANTIFMLYTGLAGTTKTGASYEELRGALLFQLDALGIVDSK